MRTAVFGLVAAVLTFGANAALAQTCGLEVCDSLETAAGQSSSAMGQTVSQAIGTAVGNRFDGNRNLATQDGGGPAATNTAYWVSGAGRSYTGDTKGYQNEAVAGIDVYLGDTSLAGAYLGAGKSSRQINTFGDTNEIVARVGGL